MKRIVAAIALATLSAFPAFASISCAPSMVAIEFHVGQHGQTIIETEKIQSPKNPDLVFQWDFWLNDETGIWAVTASANGNTCMYASGSNYNGETLADITLGVAA